LDFDRALSLPEHREGGHFPSVVGGKREGKMAELGQEERGGGVSPRRREKAI